MSGIDGFGAELRRGDGATPTEVFTAIGHSTNISGPGISRATYDVTTHQSPEQWREFIGGLKDGGEVTIDINYNPAIHDPFVEDFDDSEPRNYELAFPDPDQTVWSFGAILTGFEPTAPHDNKLSASMTFKVSGPPTITSGSA